MLDWDKPLSQQAPEVKNAFRNVPAPQGMTYGDIVDRNRCCGIYKTRMTIRGRTQADQSFTGEGLMTGNNSKGQAEAGIPGIRYLDGGSRADGAGTSNFVVFPGEESALTILERNGKPVRNDPHPPPLRPSSRSPRRPVSRRLHPRPHVHARRVDRVAKRCNCYANPIPHARKGSRRCPSRARQGLDCCSRCFSR
jgi:hypothetical protein